MIEVLRAGVCDLVMDQGRPGQGALGVPMGGAADSAALAAANRLVCNPAESAGLEIVLAGPELHFPDGGTVAFTGAKFAAHRSNGEPVSWNETLHLPAGERLTLGAAESGSRCWLAVSGGWRYHPCWGAAVRFCRRVLVGWRGVPCVRETGWCVVSAIEKFEACAPARLICLWRRCGWWPGRRPNGLTTPGWRRSLARRIGWVRPRIGAGSGSQGCRSRVAPANYPRRVSCLARSRCRLTASRSFWDGMGR